MTIEIINGHVYRVEKDAQGNIVFMAAQDPMPKTAAAVDLVAVKVLAGALASGTASATQQQQAVALILTLLAG